MTKPCSKCGQPIEESFLEYGRCHGCRVDFMDQKTAYIKARGKNSQPHSTEPRAVKRRQKAEIDWKLQKVLDKYGI